MQNILSFRFGNSIFEPLFNQQVRRQRADHRRRDARHGGRRGAYYDTAGALRDMVQNHMLQLLCLIAMEPPSALEAQAIRDEKVKVLRALVPMTREEVAVNTVRGQYGVGEKTAQIVKGYRQEEGVDPQSITETYVALRMKIDNWRWAGVPFFLRSGKRLAKRVSEIAVRVQAAARCSSSASSASDDDGVADAPRCRTVSSCASSPTRASACRSPASGPACASSSKKSTMDFLYGEAFQRALAGSLRAPAARRPARRRGAVHALRRGRVRVALHHLDPRGLGEPAAADLPQLLPVHRRSRRGESPARGYAGALAAAARGVSIRSTS